jgi:hypothetical protein
MMVGKVVWGPLEPATASRTGTHAHESHAPPDLPTDLWRARSWCCCPSRRCASWLGVYPKPLINGTLKSRP